MCSQTTTFKEKHIYVQVSIEKYIVTSQKAAGSLGGGFNPPWRFLLVKMGSSSRIFPNFQGETTIQMPLGVRASMVALRLRRACLKVKATSKVPKFQSKLAAFLSKTKVVENLSFFHVHHYNFPILCIFPIMLFHLSLHWFWRIKNDHLCSLLVSSPAPTSWVLPARNLHPDVTSVKGGFLSSPLVGVVFPPKKNQSLPTRICLKRTILFGFKELRVEHHPWFLEIILELHLVPSATAPKKTTIENLVQLSAFRSKLFFCPSKTIKQKKQWEEISFKRSQQKSVFKEKRGGGRAPVQFP